MERPNYTLSSLVQSRPKCSKKNDNRNAQKNNFSLPRKMGKHLTTLRLKVGGIVKSVKSCSDDKRHSMISRDWDPFE